MSGNFGGPDFPLVKIVTLPPPHHSLRGNKMKLVHRLNYISNYHSIGQIHLN